MFVPLFLTGGAFGKAFAMIIAHNPGSDLFAAVGMAAFIAGGYKTPLTAVVFVAEATGGHAYIIPTLIGAAVAYAVSGEASASGDQRLHEGLRIQELGRIPVREVMQENVMSLQASSSVQALAEAGQNRSHHTVFPVYEGDRLLGTAAIWSLAKIDPRLWPETPIRSIVEKQAARIPSDCDVMEALRLLRRQGGQHILLVTSPEGRLEGIITKADILAALEARLLHAPPAEDTLPDVSLSKL